MNKKQRAEKFDGEKILALKMSKNDSGQTSVREYLLELLWKLWCEGESFSGKRPFGNSGWDYDLYKPLIKSKIITGRLDSYGCVEDCDIEAGHAAICAAIEAL